MTKDALMFSMFNVFTILPKKRVESFSYFCIICQNFATFNNVCYFVVLRAIFSTKSRDTVFQNNVLSVMLVRFKFSKYWNFFCCNNFTQTLRCLACASLFSLVMSFKNLLRSLDLTMISWLSSLSIKFFWLAQMYLFLTGACLPNK